MNLLGHKHLLGNRAVKGSMEVGWSLTNAVYYDVANFSLNEMHGIFLKPDGSRVFYNTISYPGILRQRDLSVANDITTSSIPSPYYIYLYEYPEDIFITPDGTKLYIAEDSGDIFQYALSTSWDISTATYSKKYNADSVIGYDPSGMDFSLDGTKMFLVYGVYVYSFTLSIAWDVSTASLVDTVDYTSVVGSALFTGVVLNPSGTKIFLLDRSDLKVWELSLSTPYDITSKSLTQYLDVSGIGLTVPNGLAISGNGLNLYVSDRFKDTLYQYTL